MNIVVFLLYKKKKGILSTSYGQKYFIKSWA